MAATTREAIRELLQQTISTIDTLLQASDEELSMPSSHGCAQGKDVWTLLTNDIDHEKIHTGQVLECRYESKITHLRWSAWWQSGSLNARDLSDHWSD
jgi:hypothetical protein